MVVGLQNNIKPQRVGIGVKIFDKHFIMRRMIAFMRTNLDGVYYYHNYLGLYIQIISFRLRIVQIGAAQHPRDQIHMYDHLDVV